MSDFDYPSTAAYNHEIGSRLEADTTMQMTQKIASQFKKLLLARREDITRRLVLPQPEPATTQLSDDPVETNSVPRDITSSLDKHSHTQLMEMDAALARIENGTYGVCIACGKEIGTKRLVAFPCTRYCLPCKSTAKPA